MEDRKWSFWAEFMGRGTIGRLAIVADVAALLGISLVPVFAKLVSPGGDWHYRIAGGFFAIVGLLIGWLAFIVGWGAITYISYFDPEEGPITKLFIRPLYMLWIAFALMLFFTLGIDFLSYVLSGRLYQEAGANSNSYQTAVGWAS